MINKAGTKEWDLNTYQWKPLPKAGKHTFSEWISKSAKPKNAQSKPINTKTVNPTPHNTRNHSSLKKIKPQ